MRDPLPDHVSGQKGGSAIFLLFIQAALH